LSKNNLLFIGLNQVQRALVKAIEEGKGIQYLVFVINDPETIEINKHLIGFCRQFALHNFLFPKFLKKNCCDLMGTKRLTCFALKIEDKALRDDMVMRSLQEFDNHPESRTDLSEFKFAEEMLFNVCNIKRWQIDLNPKK
jgi:hypothetical protein